MVNKLNHVGDRIIWEHPTEMLDDIWLARKQRDTWRDVAEAFAISGDAESLRHAGELYAKAVRGD
jgi:hypothetical protein